MYWLTKIGPDLHFTREYLKAGVQVSLLSVWVLVVIFYYLNRYTKRRYFSIWTAAWLFYALWMSLSFGFQAVDGSLTLMLQQWSVGISAVFLLWGSLSFLGHPVRQTLLAWFMVFLLVWSYIGAYHLREPLQMQIPILWLIAIAGFFTAYSFFKYRRTQPYVGATLLTVSFFLWGCYMAAHPFLARTEDWAGVALFSSAIVQLIMAVSMIILVLEEARHTLQIMLDQAQTRKEERDALASKVISTEERYRKLFDQAGEPIVITSTEDFRILEINQAGERLLGIQPDDGGAHFLTAFCQVNIPGTAAPQNSEEWFQFLSRQRPLNLTRKNGCIVSLEVKVSQINLDGIPAYQFFLVELTERTRLEQQLRQAEKLSALGQMISGVAHELNNPLAVVKGYLELILAHHELNTQTRADLEKVAHESNRAAKLVTNFLSFARQQPAHRELVVFNDLITRLVDFWKLDASADKTEMLLELDPHLPPVSADPDQIQQLLINLMNNAVQAMADSPRQARLKIQTRVMGGKVQIAVEDNGPGVPEHLVTKIFEPFFTTKEVGTGTGLGLSIAHSIMTEHQGRIFHQESSFGSGAGFVLEFPIAKSRPVERSGSGDTAMFPSANEMLGSCKGNILVLDDEKSLAEMLSEMLDLLGYTTTTCHAAVDALELIESRNFDLVISDFRMPGINGQQFYTMALHIKPELAKRIIFVTGDVVNAETKSFLESTGNPHLAKPFNLANVGRAVADGIQKTQEAATVTGWHGNIN
jgi:signal transduction histidine kinase/ActR/RegA family two-component response regulator